MSSNNLWDDNEWDDLRARADSPTPLTDTDLRRRLKKDPYIKKTLVPTKRLKSGKKPDLNFGRVSVASRLKVFAGQVLNFCKGSLSLSRASSHQFLRMGRGISRKRGLALVIGLLIASAAGIGGWRALGSSRPDSRGSSTGVLSQSAAQPDFVVLQPGAAGSSTTKSALVYDEQRKVASYTDKIGGVGITVSQQPLPETLKNNPEEEVRKMAENFSANTLIQVAEVKAYLGTSAKGPQTLIFYKNDLLVFIQSASPIDKELWSIYVNNLASS